MTCFEDLMYRGLIKDISDPKLEELLNGEGIKFYWGTDPTADSLTIGHYSSLVTAKRLASYGHKPILLIGGATGLIGDPTGRTDMRAMLTRETIRHNVECFKKQMSRFIEFGEDKAIAVNNGDWLSPSG